MPSSRLCSPGQRLAGNYALVLDKDALATIPSRMGTLAYNMDTGELLCSDGVNWGGVRSVVFAFASAGVTLDDPPTGLAGLSFRSEEPPDGTTPPIYGFQVVTFAFRLVVAFLVYLTRPSAAQPWELIVTANTNKGFGSSYDGPIARSMMPLGTSTWHSIVARVATTTLRGTNGVGGALVPTANVGAQATIPADASLNRMDALVIPDW
jgi:hypothetical protein